MRIDGLERLLVNDMAKLPDDKSKLVFLQKEGHDANPESCWGRYVIAKCNKLAIKIMIRARERKSS